MNKDDWREKRVIREHDEPMTGPEKRMFLAMVALENEFAAYESLFEPRAREAGVWPLLRSVSGSLTKVIDVIHKRLCKSDQLMYHEMCRNGEVIVRLKSVTRRESYDYVKRDALKQVIDAVISEKCGTCMCTGADVRGCPLRKALKQICPPTVDLTDTGECTYSEMDRYTDEQKEVKWK